MEAEELDIKNIINFRLENDKDLTNFPPEFTDEPVQLTPDDPGIIGRIDQTEFEGFEYVNPLLMSAEDVV